MLCRCVPTLDASVSAFEIPETCALARTLPLIQLARAVVMPTSILKVVVQLC